MHVEAFVPLKKPAGHSICCPVDVHLYPGGHESFTDELDDKHNSPAEHVATIWP